MAQYNPFQVYSPHIQNNPYSMQPNNGINWVQGVEGAKAWQMPPSSNIMLLDSENENIFYIKTSDNVGMCSLRVFKYEEITEKQKSSTTDMSEYVKKSEVEALILSLIGGTSNEQSVSTTKPEGKSGKLITK